MPLPPASMALRAVVAGCACLAPVRAGEAGGPGLARIFIGIAAERYQPALLARSLGAGEVVAYTITNRAPALGEENEFRLDRIPPLTEEAVPGHLLMADFPLNVRNLNALTIRRLVKSVQAGSHLVVLGGLFTLNKGAFAGTDLAAILPVEVADPWAAARIPRVEILPGGGLEFIHVLPPRPGATVLAKAGDRPLWVSWASGGGRVTVFLGIPSGDGGAAMFWNQAGWIGYATDMIRKGATGE